MRMSRRAGLLANKVVTLEDLWADMSIYDTNSYRAASNSQKNVWLQRPSTGLYYIFSFYSTYMSIWRCLNGTVSATPIKQISASYGNISVRTNSMGMGYSHTYAANTYANGTATYGATIMIASFPSYTQDEIEQLLGNMTVIGLAGRDNYTNGYVRTNETTHKYLIICGRISTATTAGEGNIGIGVFDGTTWTKKAGTTTDGAKVSNGYIGAADSVSQISGGRTIIGID